MSKDVRNVVFIRDNPGDIIIEFNSNGRRVRRRITRNEAIRFRRLLEFGCYEEVDSLCYKIA